MTLKVVSPAFEKYLENLPPEQRPAAKRQFEAFALGVLQTLKGKARRAQAEKFLGLVRPGEKVAFEMIIDKLRSIRESARFDTQMVAALAFAFECGIRYGVEAKDRGDDPLKAIEEIHKVTLAETAEGYIKNRR